MSYWVRMAPQGGTRTADKLLHSCLWELHLTRIWKKIDYIGKGKLKKVKHFVSII